MVRRWIWVHGNTVRLRQGGGGGEWLTGDRGPMLQVQNSLWSDIVGLPEGWGTIFKGKNTYCNWFHFPFSNPASVPEPNRYDVFLQKVMILLNIPSGAHLALVDVWDGPNLITRNTIDGISGDFATRLVPGSNLFDINPRRRMNNALGISALVCFGQETEVTFAGAGAEFEIP